MNRNHSIHLIVVGVIASLALFAAPPSFGQSSAPDEAAIVAALSDFHQALDAGKKEQVMALLSLDALIVEGGTVQTRAEYENEHLGEDIAFARAVPGKQTSRVVRQERDTAWVTSTFRVSGKFHDKTIDNLAAETAVLTHTPDRWRIRVLHWSSHKAAQE